MSKASEHPDEYAACGHSGTMPRLKLASLRVEKDRVMALVCVPDPANASTDSALAEKATRMRPDLSIHTCVNGVGPTFGAVIEKTPLPHLLEHIVIDLQTEACPDPDRVFTGVTRWVDRRGGMAQVEVSYADDIVALRAFREAVELINSL